MQNSKWSYIGVGTASCCAIIGALVHSAPALIIGVGLTVYNWYAGEYARRIEDETLAEFIRESLKENSHE